MSDIRYQTQDFRIFVLSKYGKSLDYLPTTAKYQPKTINQILNSEITMLNKYRNRPRFGWRIDFN